MKQPEEYYKQLVRYPKKQVVNVVADDSDHSLIRFEIFTATHKYNISMRPPSETKPSGYMGCGATCRAPYPGEDWTRGNDLPDGPYSDETWQDILLGIVQYELLAVAPKSQAAAADEEEVTEWPQRLTTGRSSAR